MAKNIKIEMLPPWKKYPKINRFSIGWRMGGSEAYLHNWCHWFSTLSEKEKENYKKKYPQPFWWFKFY